MSADGIIESFLLVITAMNLFSYAPSAMNDIYIYYNNKRL